MASYIYLASYVNKIWENIYACDDNSNLFKIGGQMNNLIKHSLLRIYFWMLFLPGVQGITVGASSGDALGAVDLQRLTKRLLLHQLLVPSPLSQEPKIDG
jgi:hypothetical protein